jgi:hypothetical protein
MAESKCKRLNMEPGCQRLEVEGLGFRLEGFGLRVEG